MTSQGRDQAWSGTASLYLLASAVGVSGLVGGLITAAELENTLADAVRTASIWFFFVIGLVREVLAQPLTGPMRRVRAARRGAVNWRWRPSHRGTDKGPTDF